MKDQQKRCFRFCIWRKEIVRIEMSGLRAKELAIGIGVAQGVAMFTYQTLQKLMS